jgi:hypothetical protein
MPALARSRYAQSRYLALGGSSAPPAVTPYIPAAVTPYRDDDAYLNLTPNLVDLLKTATYPAGGVVFADVIFSRDPNADREPAGVSPTVVVMPKGFRDQREPSPKRRLRTCSYSLVIKFLAEEVEDAHTEADKLVAIAQNAIEPAMLGGFILPETNFLSDGTHDASRHPEYRVNCRGEFSYDYSITHGLRATD